MSNSIRLSNQQESSRTFLEEAYQSLEYEKGALLNALSLLDAATSESEELLEKGDWLALAQEVGAEKVFFVNDDPVIVFCALPSSHDVEAQLDMFRRVWCMGRPQCLFMALPDELRVYSLNQPPAQNAEEWKKIKPLNFVKRVTEVAEKLQDYRREQVESGRLFADDLFGSIDERADKRLIQDLKNVRQLLLSTGLDAKYVHALIGRSIFIRYLEDRDVLTPAYFSQVAENNPYWQKLLARSPEKPNLMLDWQSLRYYNVLLDKDFTYALFDQLALDFNGDMFPKDEKEKREIKQEEHLRLLRNFLLGDTDPHQPTLFFWAYDFKIIPIELISSIYEEFYHGSNFEDNNGTHYTPSVLVEYMLSQVLTPDRLATDPKILDPTCGSGIFLVESFRRVVRYQVKKYRRLLRSEELRQILKNQITGIEINEEAIRVAAFSLYLALLHYQERRDILNNKKLPNLIYVKGKKKDERYYQILFNANAFGLTNEEREEIQKEVAQKRSFAGRANLQLLLDTEQNLDVKLHSFDIVIGNPPWSEVRYSLDPLPCSNLPVLDDVPRPFRYDKTSHTLTISTQVRPTDLIKAKQLLPTEFYDLLDKLKRLSDECFQALRWAEAYKKPVGDNSYSQLFIYRSLSFLKENGVTGLLVHASVLFNQRSTSQVFRQAWLSSSTVHQIVNFAHVRTLFFSNAIAPFIFVCFEPGQVRSKDSYVIYTSARLTKVAKQLRSVILTRADRRIVKQSELKQRDYLWKTYWWGGHQDAALLAALDLEGRLQDILKDSDPNPGYGFQKGSGTPSPALQILRPLKSENLKWYGPLRDEWFEEPPSGVKRQPDESLYRGQRLLVVEGIKVLYGVVARLEYEDFSFRHTIYCVPLPSLSEWQAKLVLGMFWSSLGRYRLFMTSGNWGTWYDKTVSGNILSMPIRMPQKVNSITQRVVDAVDAIRSWNPVYQGTFGDIESLDELPPTEVREDLDEAVFDLFELSEPERDLVNDFFRYKFDLFYRSAASAALDRTRSALKTSQGTMTELSTQRNAQEELEDYLYTFLNIWNRELEPEGEFRWRVIQPKGTAMLAIVFTTQTKGDAIPEIVSSDEEEWVDVLDRCAKALRQPVSRRVYIDGLVRAVTDTAIFIIKRDEQRLWTRSMAREDAEGTLLQAVHLQREYSHGSIR